MVDDETRLECAHLALAKAQRLLAEAANWLKGVDGEAVKGAMDAMKTAMEVDSAVLHRLTTCYPIF